jgi:hypothetical protein
LGSRHCDFCILICLILLCFVVRPCPDTCFSKLELDLWEAYLIKVWVAGVCIQQPTQTISC